jgi:hypothetical protein
VHVIPHRVAAFLTVSLVIGTIVLASPAQAVSATTCSALSGRLIKPTAALTGCTSSTTGGSGTLSASSTEGVDTVSWKNGGTTNFRFKSGDDQGNRCPSGSSELVLKGKVTKSTGAASSITGAVSGQLCITGSKKALLTLVPGTVFKF